jgi:hypothetical protein
VIELLGVPLVIGSILTADVLWHDMTQTNFACLVLVACDVFCVVYASIYNIYHNGQERSRPSLTPQPPLAVGIPISGPQAAMSAHVLQDSDLRFTGPASTLYNLNLRIFEKKSN